jgi:hypothetical protein
MQVTSIAVTGLAAIAAAIAITAAQAAPAGGEMAVLRNDGSQSGVVAVVHAELDGRSLDRQDGVNLIDAGLGHRQLTLEPCFATLAT